MCTDRQTDRQTLWPEIRFISETSHGVPRTEGHETFGEGVLSLIDLNGWWKMDEGRDSWITSQLHVRMRSSPFQEIYQNSLGSQSWNTWLAVRVKDTCCMEGDKLFHKSVAEHMTGNDLTACVVDEFVIRLDNYRDVPRGFLTLFRQTVC
jgi:hypothetical protein